jgi:hypothetical protein
MTEESARRYDTEVEVLFNGTANATRRHALPQLHEVIAGRDQRKLRLLDIAAAQGAFRTATDKDADNPRSPPRSAIALPFVIDTLRRDLGDVIDALARSATT